MTKTTLGYRHLCARLDPWGEQAHGIEHQRSVLQHIIIITISFIFLSEEFKVVRLTVSGLNPPLSFPWLSFRTRTIRLNYHCLADSPKIQDLPSRTTIQRSGIIHSLAIRYIFESLITQVQSLFISNLKIKERFLFICQRYPKTLTFDPKNKKEDFLFIFSQKFPENKN